MSETNALFEIMGFTAGVVGLVVAIASAWLDFRPKKLQSLEEADTGPIEKARGLVVGAALSGSNKSPDPHRETRIRDAELYYEQQGKSVQLNKLSSTALSFSQYVVGGVLASSVMQDALSKEWVSVFGVLVLVSSILHQRYRPDIRYRVGLQRVIALRHLIRSAEDDLYAINMEAEGSPTIFELRKKVSAGISSIELLELDHLELIGKTTMEDTSRKKEINI